MIAIVNPHESQAVPVNRDFPVEGSASFEGYTSVKADGHVERSADAGSNWESAGEDFSWSSQEGADFSCLAEVPRAGRWALRVRLDNVLAKNTTGTEPPYFSLPDAVSDSVNVRTFAAGQAD